MIKHRDDGRHVKWRQTPLLFLCVLFTIILFLPVISHAAEAITVMSPLETHFAGQPVMFHIQTREFTQPVKATVFYRTIGVRSYRKLAMTSETDMDFRVLLDARKVAPPGIEYFFSLEDSKGDIFTFPSENPRKNPYQMKISLDESPPRILEHTPAASGTTNKTTPSISVKYGDDESAVLPDSVRILLDGVDVTPLAQVSADGITFVPREDLAFGEHTVTVDLADVNGNRIPSRSWSFAIAQTERFRELTGQLNLTGELRSLLDSKNESISPNWTLQSNIGLVTRMETESVKASLNANMFYQEEEGSGPAGDTFNLTNYLLQVKTGKSRFLLGDLTARGTELLSSSLSRRGGLYGFDGEKTSVEVFALRSNAVTGFDNIIGFEDPNQLIAGGSVRSVLSRDGRFVLTAAALSGKNENPDDYNASTLQPGTKGQAYSLGITGRTAGNGITFSGELAGTRYDKDLADGENLLADTAYVARIAGSGSPFNWGGSYRLLGPDFRSIANPTGASDREEVTINGGYRTGASLFALSLGHNRDNVDDDTARAVITNDTGTLNYTFAKAHWPTLFMNQIFVQQESTDEPVSYTPIKSETYTAVLGASYGRPSWSLAPMYTMTLFDDQGPSTDNDTATRVFAVSGSFRPSPSVTLSPTLSITSLRPNATGVTTETTQGALNGQFKLAGDRLTLHTTLSQLGNRLDDGSVDTETFSGTLQFNWKIRSGQDETLSLRGQYSNTANNVTDTNVEDYTIYAVLSFGVPVKLF